MKKQNSNSLEEMPSKPKFKLFLRLLGLIYLAFAILYFFFPEYIFKAINFFPNRFKIGQPINETFENFWLVLAASLMFTLSLIAFFSSFFTKVRSYTLLHILSKLITAAAFTYLFVNSQPCFAYLLGAATEVIIVLLILISFIKFQKYQKKLLLDDTNPQTDPPEQEPAPPHRTKPQAQKPEATTPEENTDEDDSAFDDIEFPEKMDTDENTRH